MSNTAMEKKVWIFYLCMAILVIMLFNPGAFCATRQAAKHFGNSPGRNASQWGVHSAATKKAM
jgi:hypothetical protein